MMSALEIGFPEVTEEAYEEIASLSDLEHKASREAEASAIAEYEAEIREQKETSSIVETMRARFWQLISQRKRDAVASFLRAEKKKRTGEAFQSEFTLLDRVLARIDALFDAVGKNLAVKRGRSVTLSFLDQVRTLRLKDVRRGKIIHLVDGRELSEELWQLHSEELLKLAGTNALNRASAHLMADEYDESIQILRGEGASGETLATFIEKSGSYVARNAGKIRDRARAHEREGDYEKAIRAWSKLASVPKLRAEALLARANAYYESQNFVAAVFDVEQLFEMNVASKKAIDILNQSYERSALITKALSIYEKASRKMPEEPKILGALVGLYMKIHEYGKARIALEQAKKLKGWDDSLGGPIHLLNIAEQGAFSGQVYKTPLGRYVVESNVDQSYTNEIASFMGNVYKMYERVFPYKKNDNLRFFVKIFRTESEFQGYFKRVTGKDAAGGAGVVTAYYMPITKELVGWKGKDLKNTLQHEGLHQFIDFYVDDCPMWFNEGFASIFETSTADSINMNRKRHQLAKVGIARKMTSLRDLLLMSRREWNRDNNKTVFFYGVSWSFIYYLVKQGKRDMLDKYFEELMKGRTRRQAFDAVFGPGKVNLAELEAKWKLAVFNDRYE
jgi:tetratricopeptide (TPR) repeat protein